MNLNGRHIVVTGGTGALGAAVASRFLEAGAEVHVTSFSATPEASFTLGGQPRLTVHAPVNLGDEAAVVALYAAIPNLWASIHVAGGFAMGALADTSLAQFDHMLSMNLRTAFLCTREAARGMTGGGRIVNVAARPAIDPTAGAGMTAYTVSKAAVAAMTQVAARELHSKGIWVNAIAPSIIDTPMNRNAMPNADFDTWPKTHELAEAIFWLASPGNTLSSGTIVPVYGKSWPG